MMSVRAGPSAHNDGQRHRGPGGGLEGVGGEAGPGPPYRDPPRIERGEGKGGRGGSNRGRGFPLSTPSGSPERRGGAYM